MSAKGCRGKKRCAIAQERNKFMENCKGKNFQCEKKKQENIYFCQGVEIRQVERGSGTYNAVGQ